MSVISHGVDLKRFRPHDAKRTAVRSRLRLTSDALVAVFVGGDWARKGLAHAIAAVAGAPPWTLLVVGPGDRACYSALAARLGAAERVTFIGTSPDPSNELASADAFVLPTDYETFSLVTYEAAAAALPLLVSRVSGPDELIVDGWNGWFLRDDPAETAAHLQRLATDPRLRRSMGAAAEASVSSYTWEAAVAAHLSLYDRLAGSQG
jgi:UDP-glucose:(heptosyl)LPS alpha-1,3-glucosyltransferase